MASKTFTKLQNAVLEVLDLKEFIFAEVRLAEDGGKYFKVNGNEFAVGAEAFIRDGSGAGEEIAADGSYKVETGEVYEVKAGKITKEIKGVPSDNGAKIPDSKKQASMSTEKVEIKAEDILPTDLAAPAADANAPAPADAKAPADDAAKEEALDKAMVADMIMKALEPILAKIAELEGGAQAMSKDVQKFAAAPAATPVKKTEAGTSTLSATEKRHSKLEELSAFLRK